MITHDTCNLESMEMLIQASHVRSHNNGLSPKILPNFQIRLSESELLERIDRYKDFISIATLFGTRILELLSDDRIVMVIADSDNCILEYFGDENMRKYMAGINMVPGACFEESIGGTSSVYLSSLHKQSIAVVGQHHFHKDLHHSACYTVPFEFEGTDMAGTITLMTSAKGHSNYRLALLESTVDSMKREYELKVVNRFQKMVNSIVDGTSVNGLIMIDQYGTVTDYNCIAENIICMPSTDIIGNHYSNLKILTDVLDQSMDQQCTISNVDIIFTEKSGKTKHCLMDAVYMFDGSYFRGIYVLIRDLTEKHELEQQMIISDRFSTIGKLTAGLAHEIRNPLTSVMGFMQLMKMSNYDCSKLNRHTNLIYDEMVRVKQLVSDFVMVSKPDAPNRSDCNLETLIRDTISLMESQALLQNVQLHTHFKIPTPSIVRMDQMQIKQVFINVIQNAIEAMETEGGIVTIECDLGLDLKTCSIVVTDNGIGMDEEQLNQMLTPFFTTKDSGSGLGMAVSYRIIESHGGSVIVTSKKGVGTKVEINLPYEVGLLRVASQ